MSENEKAAAGQGNNRIICVDDEKDIVQAYVDFLAPTPSSTPKKSSRAAAPSPALSTAQDEYLILKAHSGQEAIDLVKAELAAGRRVAAGFFDVKMGPGIDGIEAIQEVWKLDPDMHCVIVTAYQDRSVQDINTLFGESFKDKWDYLTKPFTQGEILQKARQMVAAWNRREELVAAHAKLVHAERMAAIGQVARGVGHEFNNILQRIMGKADLARMETELPKVVKHVEAILDASERAAVIIRNLQGFSKKTATDANAKASPEQVVNDTVTLVGHEFVTFSVDCKTDCKPCPPVSSDSVELQQVLTNLVINALHAMPNGGSLEIGCAPEGDGARLWVRDTGTGIAADVLPRIFEYAFTTKGDKGSGLGLSISKEIIEKRGGTLAVQSTVGKGTTFTIILPGAK